MFRHVSCYRLLIAPTPIAVIEILDVCASVIWQWHSGLECRNKTFRFTTFRMIFRSHTMRNVVGILLALCSFVRFASIHSPIPSLQFARFSCVCFLWHFPHQTYSKCVSLVPERKNTPIVRTKNRESCATGFWFLEREQNEWESRVSERPGGRETGRCRLQRAKM